MRLLKSSCRSTEATKCASRLTTSSPDFADLYTPFDALVFFADAGNGDQFGVAMRANREVYVWNHENDSRTWVAPSILRYLEDTMSGQTKV
ncbi:SMI1/KNR4 family protein [Angustibacter luteus]|uniref:SMI1/KNR4 family protein n=1 Tax=Angustibacter luteus TaxID=658456 RepID=A0ABW1JE35_9ACTN